MYLLVSYFSYFYIFFTFYLLTTNTETEFNDHGRPWLGHKSEAEAATVVINKKRSRNIILYICSMKNKIWITQQENVLFNFNEWQKLRTRLNIYDGLSYDTMIKLCENAYLINSLKIIHVPLKKLKKSSHTTEQIKSLWTWTITETEVA